MNSHRTKLKPIHGAVCTAMAAALVAGCASTGSVAMSGSSPVQSKKAERNADKAIDAAERQAEKSPQDAATRANLGNAYLMAGRFESAVTALEDARYLGDSTGRTALALGLAHIGVGNGAGAVAVLDEARSDIPVSDYGLALALAGETGRGVDVLAGALREGENTVKLRQNLAYAYALDGRWGEARVMASQDVPADKLDARITEWAHQGKPDDFRLRRIGHVAGQHAPDLADPRRLQQIVEIGLKGGMIGNQPCRPAMPRMVGQRHGVDRPDRKPQRFQREHDAAVSHRSARHMAGDGQDGRRPLLHGAHQCST